MNEAPRAGTRRVASNLMGVTPTRWLLSFLEASCRGEAIAADDVEAEVGWGWKEEHSRDAEGQCAIAVGSEASHQNEGG